MTLRAYVTFQDALTPVIDVADQDSPPPGRALAYELARGLQSGGLRWPAHGATDGIGSRRPPVRSRPDLPVDLHGSANVSKLKYR
jgi:hypothetical protein